MLPQDAFGQGVYGQPGLKVCGCHPKGLDKGHYISAINLGWLVAFLLLKIERGNANERKRKKIALGAEG